MTRPRLDNDGHDLHARDGQAANRCPEPAGRDQRGTLEQRRLTARERTVVTGGYPRRLRVSARRRGPFQASSSSWRPRSRPGSRRSRRLNSGLTPGCARWKSYNEELPRERSADDLRRHGLLSSLARVARKKRLGGRPLVGDVDSFGRPCWDRTNDQRIMRPKAAWKAPYESTTCDACLPAFQAHHGTILSQSVAA